MIKERLKLLRSEKGINQRELARDLKLSASTIGMYETGQRTPDAETLQRLADYFNTTVDYLLGRTNNRKGIVSDPTDTELVEFLQKSNIKFDGAPLDDDDKEDIINFLRMAWKRKKQK